MGGLVDAGSQRLDAGAPGSHSNVRWRRGGAGDAANPCFVAVAGVGAQFPAAVAPLLLSVCRRFWGPENAVLFRFSADAVAFVRSRRRRRGTGARSPGAV